MVKTARGPGKAKSPRPGSAGKSPQNSARGGKSPQAGGGNNGPLKTSKGVFTFTMVADGCYIEHKWGQNSGHIGVPLEAIPGFVARLQAQYRSATGQSPGVKKSPGKSPGSGGPKSAIGKGKKKEKKKPEPKKPATLEDLDADLINYTSARGADGAMAAEPAAAAPAE